MRIIKSLIIVIMIAVFMSVMACAVSPPEIFGDSDIKTSTPTGLRVKAFLDTQTAYDEATAEYGFLVTRKLFLTGNKLENEDLTFDCSVYFDKGVAKGTINGEAVDKFYDKNDAFLYFAGNFYGILPKYYTDIIVARPYIITDEGTFYGSPFEMSIYGTAKRVYADKTLYNSLSEEDKKTIFSIIVEVEGEPYIFNENDLRIVVASTVVKNKNPSYSVVYNLYNPYTCEIETGIKGRKTSKNREEIASRVLSGGELVPVYNGVVQDAHDGYVSGNFSEFLPVWISGYDGTRLSVAEYDGALSCKECIEEHVSASETFVYAGMDSAVSVFDGNYENISFSASDMQKLVQKDVSLLCHNGDFHSDYVKAYVASDENGNCKYIVAFVNGEENSALDEKCQKHTRYDVEFLVDGNLYEKQSVLYSSAAMLPAEPVKDGYTFRHWSKTTDGEKADVEAEAITEDTVFYAVFEKNPVYYTVTFVVNGEEYASYSVLENEYAKVPESPSLEGYEFIGWSESENGTVVSPENIPVNSGAVYYAVFEKLIVYHDVTFMFDGEILAQQEVLSGDSATVPETTPETAEDYKFMGWSLSNDNDIMGIIDVSAVEISEDTVFYSVIITNPNSDVFMEKLTRGYTQLKSIRRSTGLTKEVLKLLTDCIGFVLEDANNFIYVDKVHVGLTYADTVARAKQIVNEEMSSSEKSQFVNLITSTVDKDVQDFLYEYFDISTKI